MYRNLLHVVEEETMITEQAFEGDHGKVAEVLVVDGVEFALLDEIDEIGNFNDCDPVRFEKQLHAFDEAVQIRDVRENVVSQKDVGLLAFRLEFTRKLFGEKGTNAVDAGLLGVADRAVCWIDSEYRDAFLDKVAEHVSIV